PSEDELGRTRAPPGAGRHVEGAVAGRGPAGHGKPEPYRPDPGRRPGAVQTHDRCSALALRHLRAADQFSEPAVWRRTVAYHSSATALHYGHGPTGGGAVDAVDEVQPSLREPRRGSRVTLYRCSVGRWHAYAV